MDTLRAFPEILVEMLRNTIHIMPLEVVQDITTCVPDTLHARDSAGAPLLLVALAQGRQDIAAHCIAQGAAVDVRDSKTGYQPLHLAVIQDNAAMVSTLLQHGADPEAVDHAGKLPGDWVRRGSPCASLLEEACAARRQASPQHQLEDAIAQADPEKVHRALAQGADVHQDNREGIPLLAVALMAAEEDTPQTQAVLDALLRAGATLDAQSLREEEGVPSYCIARLHASAARVSRTDLLEALGIASAPSPTPIAMSPGVHSPAGTPATLLATATNPTVTALPDPPSAQATMPAQPLVLPTATRKL
jgi:hypothetical protein